jgi:peptidoglycan/xylan/chitin deacetylase (PgdA/CDA1 family)
MVDPPRLGVAHRIPPVADRRLRNRSREAAFLCFHSVGAVGPRYLTVTEELFARQLDAIEARGLRTGGVDELERLAAGRPLPPTAFLTFDDGFRDNYETVLPMLRERGMRAFVFVIPPLVDSGAPLVWPEVAAAASRHPKEMRSVDWEMLAEMREGGFEVGAHTLTHPHLPELDGESLREEIRESCARVRERLGGCETFAYPFGEWDRRAAAAVADSGIRFAFSLPTVRGQRDADELTIPRVNLDYRDSGRRLAAKLSPSGRSVYLSPQFKAIWRAAKVLRGARQ